MYTKIAIFGVISTLLVAAIYSPSTNFVFGDTVCVQTSKTTSFCSVVEGNEVSNWDCKKNPDGKTWSCKQAKTMTGGLIPPDLTDALDVAIEETQSNDTKVPKTGVLDEPNALSDDESTEDGDDGDDTKVPEDRGGLNDDGLTINPDLP